MRRVALALLASFTSAVPAADTGVSLIPELNWDLIRTEAEEAAVGAALSLKPKINALDVFASYHGTALHVVPNVDIRTGGNDAFDSVVAKLTGFMMPPTEIGADGLQHYNGYVHLIPYSIGVETDEDLKTAAAIAEVGYTPIFPKPARGRDRLGLDNGLVGAFVQWGYKWAGADDATAETGGAADESEETTNAEVLRLKAQAAYDVEFTMFGKRALVNPDLQGWYDMRNDEWYYHAEAEFKIEWRDKKYVHATYEKGSGAPNFNTGDQISVGLAVAF